MNFKEVILKDGEGRLGICTAWMNTNSLWGEEK